MGDKNINSKSKPHNYKGNVQNQRNGLRNNTCCRDYLQGNCNKEFCRYSHTKLFTLIDNQTYKKEDETNKIKIFIKGTLLVDLNDIEIIAKKKGKYTIKSIIDANVKQEDTLLLQENFKKGDFNKLLEINNRVQSMQNKRKEVKVKRNENIKKKIKKDQDGKSSDSSFNSFSSIGTAYDKRIYGIENSIEEIKQFMSKLNFQSNQQYNNQANNSMSSLNINYNQSIDYNQNNNFGTNNKACDMDYEINTQSELNSHNQINQPSYDFQPTDKQQQQQLQQGNTYNDNNQKPMLQATTQHFFHKGDAQQERQDSNSSQIFGITPKHNRND